MWLKINQQHSAWGRITLYPIEMWPYTQTRTVQIRLAWYLLGNVQEVNMVKPCQNSPSNWSLLWISFISLALGGHKIWRKQCEASRATNRHVFLFFASFRQIDVCIQKVSNHRITSKWRKMVTLIGFLQENILKIQSVFL